MSKDSHRRVDLVRTGSMRFQATNVRGTTLEIGSGDDDAFTPVELLLVALAGCGALDVDAITGKRAEAEHFAVVAEAEKVRDTDGNHLTGIRLDFTVDFPATEAGSAAESVLRRAIEMSHDRLCTVSRTVQLGTPVQQRLRGVDVGGAGGR